jgi:FtsH-binding integral membrane protein
MQFPIQQSHGYAQSAAHDEGLRQYMLKVYNYMASGLVFTGLVAMLTANTPALLGMLYNVTPQGVAGMTPLGWIVAFAPLGMVFLLGFKQQSMSLGAVKTWFWVFAGIMGLSLTSIFLLYTGASIARVFFITAGVFGGMSIYGYTTKKDLTSWGSFLVMGLWGVLLAGVVNIFLQSPMLYFISSIVGVILAIGLTAYDTQKIKAVYFQVAGSGEAASKAAIMGAFQLYFDFIYLFIHLMHLFGERR